MEIAMIIKTAERIIGERNMGRILYLFKHSVIRHSGPFNEQLFRLRIFFELLYCFPIDTIVETGTHFGKTTALFASTALPVYTCEISKRFYSFSKMRFFFNCNRVHLFNCDSRSFLRQLSKNDSVSKGYVFFYLDAHWREDLPLQEELEIIFSKWCNPIVMVDDFMVPGFDYKYDDYGNGKALTVAYIEEVVSDHELSVYFPSVNASEETGAKKGCVVLCRRSDGARVDEKVATLKKAIFDRGTS